MTMIIGPKSDLDPAAIREVNRLAFDGEGEAWLVDALRDGGLVPASLVAEEGGWVVGHILFSELPIVNGGWHRRDPRPSPDYSRGLEQGGLWWRLTC